jgi:selenocysteine-specific elongation factor
VTKAETAMKHIVIGTAGHIDHGKSALVQALTGTDPDRLKEEKARGITIDLGFAHWHAEDLSVAFVDVPGHERFVKNMLAGVGGLDAVMLIVAADESVMPQTREHFEICRLLRVPAGLVALTKIDLVDPEMIDLVRADVAELVRGSFLAGAPTVPVSARTGAGLDALRAAIEQLGRAAPGRRAEGPARLPIDRVFSMRGFGTVATGTLVSGQIATDDALAVLPGGREVKVRGLQVHGERLPLGVAGQRVAVNLAGVGTADLARGQTLVTPAAFGETRVVDARLELLASANALRHGARVRFHQGTSEVLGRVALSSLVADRVHDGADQPVATDIPPARSAYVRIRLEAPIVVTRGDRFIVRAYSPPATIGGGVVLDPQPPRAGIRAPAGRARFAELDPAAAGDARAAARQAVMLAVGEAGAEGLPLASLSSRLGLITPGDRQPVDTLRHDGAVTAIGTALFSPSHLASVGARLVELVEQHHRDHPMDDGIPREEARERLYSRAAPGVFERAVDDLAAAGRITGRDRLAPAAGRAEVSGADAAARDALVSRYLEAGLHPPDQVALAEALGLPAQQVAQFVALLVRQKVLARVEGLVFHESALRKLKEDVRQMKAAAAGATVTIDVAAFKDRYAMTRKFAIPLLEYLDRERVTKRVGDSRVVL